MRDDKFVRWLVNMVSHKKHRKRILGGQTISRKQFERLSGASENDKEFNKFFKELLDEGIIVESKEKKYLIEPHKALSKIRSYGFGDAFWNLTREYYLLGLK